MKKSQLIKIIKEEVTKVLHEKQKDKLQISIPDTALKKIGVPDNIIPKVMAAINRLRNPKGTIEDQPLSLDDYKALSSVLVNMIATDENTELRDILNRIIAAKTITTDVQ
jgi:hypothetical protein